MEKGLIHVYTGDGKGKTTAALGLTMRAAGWGWRVLIIQFMKGRMDDGERKFVEVSGIEIKSYGRESFVDPKNPTKKDFEEARKAVEKWKIEMKSGKWDMIILDEINVAIKFGLIKLEETLELIKNKPKNLELVLTGRWVAKEIIEITDYVTEMKEVKHPYKKGIRARKGIEY